MFPAGGVSGLVPTVPDCLHQVEQQVIRGHSRELPETAVIDGRLSGGHRKGDRIEP